VAYIDKFVQADTDQFNIKGRKTILSYTLPTDAFSSVITVKDKAGNIVGTFNGGTAKGANSLAWDGKNLDGTEMEEGDYDFTVEAKNALGDAITASDLAHNKQPGAAILAYNLPRKAETATVSITDATGKVLASFEGKTAAGENKIAWDGKDSNGNVVPDGEYKFNIKAKDDKGVDITAQTLVTDLVTQVDLHGDSTTLYLDKIQVDLGKVISIKSGYAKI
jgi:flagellar hook assembly protein FlgD